MALSSKEMEALEALLNEENPQVEQYLKPEMVRLAPPLHNSEDEVSYHFSVDLPFISSIFFYQCVLFSDCFSSYSVCVAFPF